MKRVGKDTELKGESTLEFQPRAAQRTEEVLTTQPVCRRHPVMLVYKTPPEATKSWGGSWWPAWQSCEDLSRVPAARQTIMR